MKQLSVLNKIFRYFFGFVFVNGERILVDPYCVDKQVLKEMELEAIIENMVENAIFVSIYITINLGNYVQFDPKG